MRFIHVQQPKIKHDGTYTVSGVAEALRFYPHTIGSSFCDGSTCSARCNDHDGTTFVLKPPDI